ncbi:MAG: hypothetical protein WBV73_24015 [Phormidium sp.]
MAHCLHLGAIAQSAKNNYPFSTALQLLLFGETIATSQASLLFSQIKE